MYSANLATSYPDIITGAGRSGSRSTRGRRVTGCSSRATRGRSRSTACPRARCSAPYGAGGGGLNAIAFDPGQREALRARRGRTEDLASPRARATARSRRASPPTTSRWTSRSIAGRRVYAPIHHANELAVVDTGNLAADAVRRPRRQPVRRRGRRHQPPRVRRAEPRQPIVDVDSGPAGAGPYADEPHRWATRRRRSSRPRARHRVCRHPQLHPASPRDARRRREPDRASGSCRASRPST